MRTLKRGDTEEMKLSEKTGSMLLGILIGSFYILGWISYALKYRKLVKECLECKKNCHPECTNDCIRNPNGIHDRIYPQLTKCIIKVSITAGGREELERMIEELD